MSERLKEIIEYHEQFGIQDLSTMHTTDYRKTLEGGAFIWIDHHDHVRSTFSEEVFATNTEQLDVFIGKLKEFREKMSEPPEWMSEK
ncbi:MULTISPECIES: hypothetical protein [Serratia]|uniref:hypothetical protein n=1 Tax=Serratia TaxID=613 RepID=UPI0018D78F9E|nr:hypothetical protein [Serratia marcescens]MBH2769612.1 hypothetical protein [Serratia marcescens]BEN51569.1 hypothetical protein SMKC057_36810 [Serratia marcescens]CAI1727748.1 Uncharacterised protein [Serratia marcescens]HCD7748899.1 hypothetical protein [Serratia marcescens]